MCLNNNKHKSAEHFVTDSGLTVGNADANDIAAAIANRPPSSLSSSSISIIPAASDYSLPAASPDIVEVSNAVSKKPSTYASVAAPSVNVYVSNASSDSLAHTSASTKALNVANGVTNTSSYESSTAELGCAKNHETIEQAVINLDQSTRDWIKVSDKRRNKNELHVIGSNNNIELNVAVAAQLKWLHLASFLPTVSPSDILQYVEKHSGISKDLMSCFSLVKKDVESNTLKRVNFKLGVPEDVFGKLLRPEIWPAKVTVRPFRFFQRKPIQSAKT